jgi:bifunctional DNA-binding transcriptional regulator/antitoxin component of YhaV-PrlF toxin-antitoxin module
MFTGYDVTIETRSRESVKLRHEECRGAIHEIQILNDAIEFGHEPPSGPPVHWMKSQKSMSNGQWAFVYHPSNVDPQGYQPRATSNFKDSTSPSQVASISSIASDSGGLQSDGSFLTDHRNRLLIPTRFLEAAGLKPGNQVCVLSDANTNTVWLCKDDPFNDATIRATTQVVERNGDIRLSSRTLSSASLNGSKFVIENTNKNNSQLVQIKVA